MKTNPVSLKFTSLNTGALVNFALSVHEKVTSQPAFSDFHPTPDELKALITGYQSAILAAADGGRMLARLKNNAREALLTALRSWSVQVGQQCKGDFTVLMSSGFAASKPASPAVPLPAPSSLILRATPKSGQVSARVPAEANGRIYEYQTANSPAPDGVWTTRLSSTASRVKLDELTPGELTWVRARVQGAAGFSPWSQPVSVRAA